MVISADDKNAQSDEPFYIDFDILQKANNYG